MGIFDIFKKSAVPVSDARLTGRWILVSAEGDLDIGDGVRMEFLENGELLYTIRQGDKAQIMKMTYRIDGDQLISNQPSAPQEARTTFAIEDGLLVLHFEGTRSCYKRESDN